jgi:thiamine pyrophosphate-dependent acetolactate synthase large subunit-like protein
VKQVSAAQERVAVIVDGCALRYGVTDEVKDFLEKTMFPVFVSPMGKSAVDESYERFGGVRPACSRTLQSPSNPVVRRYTWGSPVYRPLNRRSNKPH